MNRMSIAAALVAAGAMTAFLGYSASTLAQGYGPGYGPGMMGPGYGPGMMHGYGPGYGPGMGPGMMGPGYGPGMMGGWGRGYGPGMMMGPGYGHGPGMMYGYGRGYGPGMMGPGWQSEGNLNLSTDDVKTYLERWIAVQGNPRLKVGDVKEKDANTIEADIVTKEGNALVQRFTVDRHTGFYRPSAS